jgi:hypothetical protein
MKNLLIMIGVMTLASALGQGTITFTTRNTLGTPPYFSQVFFPDVSPVQKTGNTAANLPAGTQSYGGAPLTGSGWSAALWVMQGSTLPAGPFTSYGVPVTDNFLATSPVTTFRTGTSAGSVALVTSTLPFDGGAGVNAVVQMRVWPSSLGSWASAVSAFNSGDPLAIIGASPAFVLNNIGGGIPLVAPPQYSGVSFALVWAIPEPSSVALFGLGLSWLAVERGMRRRNADLVTGKTKGNL